MATRVTAANVQAITKSSREDMAPFIQTANVLVDQHVLGGVGVTTALLFEIELYLAAHFLTVSEERGGLVRSETGESSDTYGIMPGQGFIMTRFGQQAMALDPTGNLRRSGTGRTASLKTFPRRLVSTDSSD